MKKAAVVFLACVVCIAVPSLAQSYADNRESDAAAIYKDDQALSKDEATLAHNRAAKAVDKANNNVSGQAVDSLKIGANRTAISEKKTEKDIDQHIQKSDEGQ